MNSTINNNILLGLDQLEPIEKSNVLDYIAYLAGNKIKRNIINPSDVKKRTALKQIRKAFKGQFNDW